MGWWTLKPKEQLDPHVCLQFGQKDDLGEEYCDVMDIIEFDVEDDYKISEVDIEHVSNLIRQGFSSGDINDWDWKSEQELEIKN